MGRRELKREEGRSGKQGDEKGRKGGVGRREIKREKGRTEKERD